MSNVFELFAKQLTAGTAQFSSVVGNFKSCATLKITHKIFMPVNVDELMKPKPLHNCEIPFNSSSNGWYCPRCRLVHQL